MDFGWYDTFSEEKIDRNIDSNGIVSYSLVVSNHKQYDDIDGIITTSTPMELMEIFNRYLKNSKNTLTPELKQVIDDIPLNDINNVWGISKYFQKTLIGHAIDEMNSEALEYLITKGADVNVPGTNQEHVLQELLESNAIEKRIKILKIVLPHLLPGTVVIKKRLGGNFYSIKYLVQLINFHQIDDDVVKMIYENSPPKHKKILIKNCIRVINYAEEEYLPTYVKNIFTF